MRERQMKERITVANYEVMDLSYRIAAMMSKDAPEERHLWDYFPEFFKNEKVAYEENQEQNELENFKAGRRRFAAEHNKRWREKHGSAE